MFKNVNALCRVMFEESNSVVSAEAQVIETAVPASRVSQTETRFSNIPLQSERRLVFDKCTCATGYLKFS
jgi:hypothetical protein